MEESQTSPIADAQSLIDQANNAAARTEAANKRSEELLARLESQAAIDKIEGRSMAGVPSKPVEETPQEYAARVMKGIV